MRTLFAGTEPLPDDDGALRQSVEQSLLGLDAIASTERLEFVRAEMSEAEAAADAETAERLRREVLELKTQRLDLDRRRDEDNSSQPTKTQDPGRTAATT